MATISLTYTSNSHGIINFSYPMDEKSMSRVVHAMKQSFKEAYPQKFEPDMHTGEVREPSVEESLELISAKLVHYIVSSVHELETEEKMRQFRQETPLINVRLG